MFEDPVFRGDIAYEYLASEASGTSGSYLADWPVYSPLTGCAYTYFATPPLPMSVLILRNFLGLTQRFHPGMALLIPQHLPCRHPLRNHPPTSKAENHLQNRGAVKAHLRTTMTVKNGAVVYAETSFARGTNASDT